MKNYKSLFILLVILLTNVIQAGADPVRGSFDPQKLAGSYRVTRLIVKSVYSTGSKEQDMSPYWTKASPMITYSEGNLVIKNKPGGDGLDAKLSNINGGYNSSNPSRGGIGGHVINESYTTNDGVFFVQMMVLGSDHGIPPSEHSYYETVQLSLSLNGDLQLVKFKADCPGIAGICGPISSEDIYSSSTTYTAILQRKP